jgi:hypothetical protein
MTPLPRRNLSKDEPSKPKKRAWHVELDREEEPPIDPWQRSFDPGSLSPYGKGATYGRQQIRRRSI